MDWTHYRWAVLSTVIGAMLGFIFGLAVPCPSPSQMKAANTLTQDKLRAYYDVINSGWFAGSLPDDVELRFTSDIPYDTQVLGLTDLEHGHFVIYVNPDYNIAAPTAIATIIHEDCHIWTWGEEFEDHGPKFQACMLNLAEHGAFARVW